MHDYNYNTNAKKSNTLAVEITVPDREFINAITTEKDNFFNIDNRDIYLKYFSEDEVEKLRSSSQSKISSAIISKAAEHTELSRKTIYSVLNGNKSTYNTLNKLLNFFGVELVLNHHFNKKTPATLHENIDFKYTTSKDKAFTIVMNKISLLDEEQLKNLTPYIDFMLTQTSDKNKDEDNTKKSEVNEEKQEPFKYKIDKE